MTAGTETCVKVVVRCRPLLGHEDGALDVSKIDEAGGSIKIGDKTHKYGPGGAVGGTGRHDAMYDVTTKPLVAQLFDGYNATVLAYGQTGSGKTYTMGTAFGDEPDGVVPRAVVDIMARRAALLAAGDRDCGVVLSLCEVYNEEVRDLLADRGGGALKVQDAAEGGGVRIAGLSEHGVESAEAVYALTRDGMRRRATGSTNMNEHSSRSHMILSFKVEVGASADGASSKTCSKLHLVDLAGSERAKRTGATGDRLREGIQINSSLLALGNVIARLVELQGKGGGGRDGHVPYRDSALTRLLSDSLGGTAHTTMIACVSPNASDADESLNTLRWADRATLVKNVAGIHVVVDPKAERLRAAERAELEALRAEARLLRARAEVSARAGPAAADEAAVAVEREKLAAVLKVHERDQKRWRRERSEFQRTIGELGKRNAALDRRCGVLRLAIPPEAREAAEAALPVDDDVALVLAEDEARRATGEHLPLDDEGHVLQAARRPPDSDESDGESDDDDDELEQERKLATLALEEKCMDSLKQHYERAIEKLEAEVAALEVERRDLAERTRSTESEAATRVLREKARKLELHIARLRGEAKKATGEVQRCAQLKDRAERDARALRAEVEEARKRRGELQRRLQRKDADHAKESRSWKREAKRLQRDNDRVKGEKTKLVQRFARQEQTQARQLAEARAALRRARQNATIAYSAAAKPTQAKRSRSPGPGASRPRAGKALVPEDPDAMPAWLEVELERRADRARGGDAPDDARRPSTDGFAHVDTLEDAVAVLDRLADEAARARAAERDARSAVAERKAQDKAAHRSWLNGERVKYKQRQTLEKQRQSETLNALMAGVHSIAGEAFSPRSEPAADDVAAAPPPPPPPRPVVVVAGDGDDAPPKAVVAIGANHPHPLPPPDGSPPLSLAQREYESRRARQRNAVPELLAAAAPPPAAPRPPGDAAGLDDLDLKMGDLMTVVAAVRRDRGLPPPDAGPPGDPRALRDVVERNYAKPWQVNAQLAPRAAAAADADAERKRGDYDRPWRVAAPRAPAAADAPPAPPAAAKADQPPPPPGSRFSDVEIAEEIAAREAIGASTKSCRASLDGEYDANDENRTPQIPS